MFSRLYSRARTYHNELLWTLFSVIAVTAFIALHPVFMLKWNKVAAHEKATAWVSQAKQAQTINAAEWWEFRATFAPGAFTYNPDRLAVFSILQLKNLSLTEPNHLFTYTAWDRQLTSDEWLTVATLTEKAKQDWLSQNTGTTWVVEKSDTLVGTKEGKIVLWMSRSLDEMKQVNGLINYEDPDKVLERNQWQWITTAEWTE